MATVKRGGTLYDIPETPTVPTAVTAVQTARDVIENFGGPNGSGTTTPPDPAELAIEESLKSSDSANSKDRGYSGSSAAAKSISKIANTGDNIDWPSVQNNEIFGLPPINIVSSQGLDDISIQEELVRASFPILEITPVNVNHDSDQADSQKKVKVTDKTGYTYKFACRPDGDISFSHSNEYSPTFVENAVSQVLSSDVMRDMFQLGKVTGGPVGKIASGTYNSLDAFMTKLNETLRIAMEEQTNSPDIQAVGSTALGLGADTMRAMVLGARMDIPNVWKDSKTNLTWGFSIRLRTMAFDPTSNAYYNDIIKPMSILLQMALPRGGETIAYNFPSYIKAKMGNMFETKLAGISNISWSAPMSEMNLRGVVREINVNITLVDLYNIMVAGEMKQNDAFPSREHYLDTVLKRQNSLSSKLTAPALPSKSIQSTTQTSSTGSVSDAAKEKKALMDQYAAVSSGDNIYNSMLANANTDMLSVFDVEGVVDGLNPLAIDIDAYSDLYDPAGILSGSFDFSQLPTEEYATMGMSLGSGALSLTSASKQIFSIPNITQLTSTASLTGMLLNGQSLSIPASALSAFDIDSNIYMNYDSTPGYAVSTMTSRLFSFFNKTSVYKLSNGIFTGVPGYHTTSLPSVIMPLIQDFIANDDLVDESIVDYLGISSYALWGASSVALSVANGSGVNEATLYNAIVNKINSSSLPLSSILKSSSYSTSFVSKAASSLVNNLFSNTNVINELASFRNSVRSDSEFNTGIDNLYKHMGTMMGITTMEGLLKQTYKKRYCKVHIGVSA